MGKDAFIKLLENADSNVCYEHALEVIQNSIDNEPLGLDKGERNLVIVMEELAELSQQVSKVLRGKVQFHDLLEEMADVTIALMYLKEICKISNEELSKAVNVKFQRIEEITKMKKEFK